MEKLQNALAQARQARGQSQGTKPHLGTPQRGGGRGGGSPDDLWTGLASFMPDNKLLQRNRVVTKRANSLSTNFDILRTKMLALMRQNDWTRIAITSPAPSCGKTTTAANLALGLGRQEDHRTMLFDLDLRRPGIAKIFGLQPKSDITHMLSGKVPVQEQLICMNGNIAVSAAKDVAVDPSRHLLSEASIATLAQIEEDYRPDVMLFDLPPLLVTEDTRAFLKNVDAAILVAQAEATTANQIDLCEKEIAEHTNFLGVVLNRCMLPDQSMGTGYGYGGY